MQALDATHHGAYPADGLACGQGAGRAPLLPVVDGVTQKPVTMGTLHACMACACAQDAIHHGARVVALTLLEYNNRELWGSPHVSARALLHRSALQMRCTECAWGVTCSLPCTCTRQSKG